MYTLTFTFDGFDYHIKNADDGQAAPQHGDSIYDATGREVVYVTHDGEHWVAESCTGPEFVTVHENEDDAAWTAVKACIAGQC